MIVSQTFWSSSGGWERPAGPGVTRPQLVLVFGARAALEDPRCLPELARAFPGAKLVGCSTAGEIRESAVHDETAVATAIELAHGRVEVAEAPIDRATSLDAGRAVGAALPAAGLRHVLVLSDGLQVNGTELVRGIASALPPGVAVTGGLSADGARFERTLVCVGTRARSATVVAVGLYGERLHVGFGSMGGWDPFGPDRVITRSQENVLFELDGEPALSVYKDYLGPDAAELPASGLLFPLLIQSEVEEGGGLVRTILGVDERAASMTFAGDVPEGTSARFMKASFDRLVTGATGAAASSRATLEAERAELAILISCVGRKLLLKQRIDEEVEAVRDVLGPSPLFCGFYSYGEISPLSATARCELHNQTMTVTTLAEV